MSVDIIRAPAGAAVPGSASIYGGDSPTAMLAPSGAIAAWSTEEYVGDDKQPELFCTFVKDDWTTCKAPKAKGTQFCVGHLRSAVRGLIAFAGV